ncbi:DUF485 domain-containing protein [Streptomyces sp. PSKA54]|uniref:DUF485 domain-containing protein n=1 Tax=Streptomyces himalayensis subsp. aureolus TaxID=2758039 RepID=A0A7W2D9C5_9ACTN|nr:DUF485 domain-containing protein [Streptomyces himalayensis]MBA4866920.1 DUF485 domain-containing protein [Streptomyces himalayensis subsp. aureolus]
MDSLDLHPDQDPPAAAALYLSTLDHQHHHSNAELRQAMSHTYAAFDQPVALLDVYRRSVQGAHAVEYDIRAKRRSWALRMARHLAMEDGRHPAAPPTPAAWEEPVAALSEPSPRTYATSPSDQADPSSVAKQVPFPDPRQTAALRELRAAGRRPAQVAAAVVGAQMAGVILANETPGFMALSLAGPLNIGLTLVLVQLVLTGWAVLWYVRYARNSLEPTVERHSGSFAQMESHR